MCVCVCVCVGWTCKKKLTPFEPGPPTHHTPHTALVARSPSPWFLRLRSLVDAADRLLNNSAPPEPRREPAHRGAASPSPEMPRHQPAPRRLRSLCFPAPMTYVSRMSGGRPSHTELAAHYHDSRHIITSDALAPSLAGLVGCAAQYAGDAGRSEGPLPFAYVRPSRICSTCNASVGPDCDESKRHWHRKEDEKTQVANVLQR